MRILVQKFRASGGAERGFALLFNFGYLISVKESWRTSWESSLGSVGVPRPRFEVESRL